MIDLIHFGTALCRIQQNAGILSYNCWSARGLVLCETDEIGGELNYWSAGGGRILCSSLGKQEISVVASCRGLYLHRADVRMGPMIYL